MSDKLKNSAAMCFVNQVIFFSNDQYEAVSDLPWNYTMSEAANINRLLKLANKNASSESWKLLALIDRKLIHGQDMNKLVDGKSTLILAQNQDNRLETEVSEINDCQML